MAWRLSAVVWPHWRFFKPFAAWQVRAGQVSWSETLAWHRSRSRHLLSVVSGAAVMLLITGSYQYHPRLSAETTGLCVFGYKASAAPAA